MLDARFSHIFAKANYPTPQRGLSAIAEHLVELAAPPSYKDFLQFLMVQHLYFLLLIERK